MTPTGVAPDHFIDFHIVVLCATESQAHTATAMTHNIPDPHPIEISLQMTADPNYTNLTSNTTNQQKDLLQTHNQCLGKIKTEDTNRSQSMTPPQKTIVQMTWIVTLRMI